MALSRQLLAKEPTGRVPSFWQFFGVSTSHIHLVEKHFYWDPGELHMPTQTKMGNPRQLVFFLVSILLIAGVAVFAFVNTQRYLTLFDQAEQVEDTLFELTQFLSHMKDVEIGSRSYMLTGQRDFLEPYQAGRFHVEQNLTLLQDMLSSDEGQFERLRILSNELLQNAELVVAHGHMAAVTAADQELLDRDKAIVDQIRDYVPGIIDDQRALLNQERSAARGQALFTVAIAVLGAIVSAIILGVFALNVRGQSVKRLKAENDLNDLNDELEERIRTRTEQIQEKEARLSSILAASPDAVVAIEATGQIVFASDRVRDVFGYDPEEIVGGPVETLMPGRYRDGHAGHLRNFLSNPKAREMGAGLTLSASRKDGSEFPVEISLNPEASGTDMTIVAAIRDTSERTADMALMESLRTATEQAKVAEVSKSQFLANMSHELRTPMNGVLGFTDLLLNTDLTQVQRNHVTLIAESGDSMLVLLNSILDLAKIESGTMQAENISFDIRHTINSSCRLMRAAAEHKGLAINLTIDGDVPQYILGDKYRTKQILSNIIGNAVKFTSTGSISISALVGGTTEAQKIEITITDTGIGIAAEHHEEIFGEFSQAERSIGRRFGGSGLGLAISRKLLGALGGDISFKSEVGKGTSFFVTLPLVKADEPASLTRVSKRSKASKVVQEQSKRILVAEDHPINQALITAFLEKLGHSFDTAEDGAEAIKMIKLTMGDGKDPYSIVLMDVQMPNVDGLQATRQIRRLGISAEELPIVAVTAHAYQEDIEACHAAGMQDHLSKPVLLDDLRETLEHWLSADASSKTTSETFPISESLRERYDVFRREVFALHGDCQRSLPDTDPDQLDRLKEILHKLAGSAAAFGEADLGNLCSELEAEIDGIAAGADAGTLEPLMAKIAALE